MRDNKKNLEDFNETELQKAFNVYLHVSKR